MLKYVSLMARCLAIMCAFIIAHQSLQPGSGFPPTSHTDKFYHAGAYGLLAALVTVGWPSWRSIYVWVGLMLFGASLELAQGLLDIDRTASWLDGIANAIGISVILVLRAVFERFR